MSAGAFVDSHPVDQQVLLILSTTKGSIPGLENFGSDLSAITHIDEKFEASVKNAVSRDLQRLIVEKKIRLISVEILPNENNRIEIKYNNLIKNSEERVQL